MSKDKQIVTKQENPLAVFNADDMADLGSVMSTAIAVDSNMIKHPTLTLTQSLSSQFKAGKAPLGDFYCEMKSKNYGKSPILIPLSVRTTAGYYDKEKESLICSSADSKVNREGVKCVNCPHGEGTYWNNWDAAILKKHNLKKPRCTQAFDYYFLVKEEDGNIDPMPMKYSFRSLSFKAGKSLYNKILMHPNQIPFFNGYILSVEKEPKGNFFIKEGGEKRVALSGDELRLIKDIFLRLNNAIAKGLVKDEYDEAHNAEPSNEENDIEFDNSFPEEM